MRDRPETIQKKHAQNFKHTHRNVTSDTDSVFLLTIEVDPSFSIYHYVRKLLYTEIITLQKLRNEYFWYLWQ